MVPVSSKDDDRGGVVNSGSLVSYKSYSNEDSDSGEGQESIISVSLGRIQGRVRRRDGGGEREVSSCWIMEDNSMVLMSDFV